MEISPLGMIAIPLGIVLFWKGTRLLLWATVMTIPFFHTTVAALPFAFVRPFQYFGALLILRRVVEVLSGIRKESVTVSTADLAVCLFLGVVLISLFMPALLSGMVYVVPESTSFSEYSKIPLTFTVKNLSQSLYPFFGAFLFFALQSCLRTIDDINRVIKINVGVLVLLIVYAIAYQVSYLTGAEAFMDGFVRFVGGDVGRLWERGGSIAGLRRTFTPVGEPGFTALYFLFVLGLLIGLRSSSKPQDRLPRSSGVVVGMGLFALLLTGSTTAYVGFVTLVAALLGVTVLASGSHNGVSRELRSGFHGLLPLAVAVVGAAALFVVLGVSLSGFLELHRAKLVGVGISGLIRLQTIQYTVQEVFAKSPFLGVGFGSHRTFSLAVALLANTGILGLATFLLFNATVFRRALVALRSSQDETLTSLLFAQLTAHATLLPVLLVTGFESIVFGWYWLLLAMMEATYRIARHQAKLNFS